MRAAISRSAGLLAAAVAAFATPVSAAAAATFAVSYSGGGSYATVYHSIPPNPGGRHDTNDARDTSHQRWSLRFAGPLSVCDQPGCATSLTGARGTAAAWAQVDHHHRDGLYRADDVTLRCSVRASARRVPAVGVRAVYEAASGSVVLSVSDPIGSVLGRLPAQCPHQGDSVDGLLDSYWEPGFSFAPGFGEQRWFTPAPLRVPLSTLLRARSVRLTFRVSPANRPPAGCAVLQPAIERCRTGGRWAATLTLTRLAT